MNRWLLLLTTACLAACDDDRQSLWIDLFDLSHSAQKLQMDIASHGRLVDEATPEQLDTLERQLVGVAGATLDAMTRRLQEMARCTRPEGGGPDLAGVATVIARIRGDLHAHAVAMPEAELEGAGLYEEQRFQTASDGRFDELRATLPALEDGAAAYQCRLHE